MAASPTTSAMLFFMASMAGWPSISGGMFMVISPPVPARSGRPMKDPRT